MTTSTIHEVSTPEVLTFDSITTTVRRQLVCRTCGRYTTTELPARFTGKACDRCHGWMSERARKFTNN